MARVLAAVIIASCAASRAQAPVLRPAPASPTLGATHARETRTIEPQGLSEAEPRPIPTVSARRLLVATDELDTSGAPPDRAHIVTVLYALADALDVVAPDRANEILRVREVTDELGRSAGPADADTALVRIALDSAARALAHVQPEPDTDRTRLARALDALRDATDRVDPDRPLLAQARQLRSAFRASVHAVYAATGAPDPEIATTPTARR